MIVRVTVLIMQDSAKKNRIQSKFCYKAQYSKSYICSYIKGNQNSRILLVMNFVTANLRASLKNIAVVNGKTQTQLMLPNTFINCTGKIRYFNNKKIIY
jgi:hypothetical protein